MELIGFLLGFLYLWLELRASIYLWIVGAIMPAVYAYVYFEAGLYADCGIQIYYILAAVYGAWAWIFRKGKDAAEVPITQTPRRFYAPLVAVAVLCFGLLSFLLVRFTDSTVPFSDAFTTALSIVAMWMLSRKYLEQWLVWGGVDLLYVVLYVYKDLHFTALLYAVYAVIAIYGYFKWKREVSK